MTLFVIVHLSNCSNFRCSQEIANFYPKVSQNRSITIDYAMDMCQLQKNPTPSSSFQMQHSVTFSRNDNDNVTSYIYMVWLYCEIFKNGILWNIGKWNIWISNILEYLGEEYEGRYIWHLTSTVRYSDTAGFCDKSNTIFWHHCQHNSTLPIIQYQHSLIRATLA